jgi:hypothetical protein
VRASAGISATDADVDRFLDALRVIVSTPPAVAYQQDAPTGDYWVDHPAWDAGGRALGASCGRG